MSVTTIAPAKPERQVTPRPREIRGRVAQLSTPSAVQAAVNAAKPGDVLIVAAGLMLPPLTAPPYRGPGWITLVSSAANPAAGTRVTPLHASAMFHTPFFGAAPGSGGLRVIGMSVERDPLQTMVYALVDCQNTGPLAFERCCVLGTPTQNTRRGFQLNGGDTAIVDSWVDDIHEVGADAQGICGWNGRGPYLIENTEVRASTENILFGGSDPSVKGLIPADITIRRCHLTKPVSVLVGERRKNLLEMKNAQRWVVEDCDLDDFPDGVAFVLTPRNQEGSAPWSTVQDGRIENCRVRNVGTVFSGQTTDNERSSGFAARIAIRNLLGLDVSNVGWSWGSGGPAVMDDLEIARCTILPNRRAALQITGAPLMFRRLSLVDNLFGFGSYSQQWIDQLVAAGMTEDSDIRGNRLVNAGDLDGGGPERNRMDGVRFISIPAPAGIGLDLATGQHTLAGVGYQVPTAAPDPPDPLPAPAPDPTTGARLAALEARLAKIKAAFDD